MRVHPTTEATRHEVVFDTRVRILLGKVGARACRTDALFVGHAVRHDLGLQRVLACLIFFALLLGDLGIGFALVLSWTGRIIRLLESARTTARTVMHQQRCEHADEGYRPRNKCCKHKIARDDHQKS
jgi:hypothetical protein